MKDQDRWPAMCSRCLEPLSGPIPIDEAFDDIVHLVSAAYDYLTITDRIQAATKALWEARCIAEDYYSWQDDQGEADDAPQPGHVVFENEEAKRDV